MRNYIYKIAKDNIKKNKKFYRYIFIAIFITIFIIMISNILINSFHYSTYLDRTEHFGKWDCAFIKPDQEVIELIKNDSNIIQKGNIYYGGEVINKGKNIGYIGYYDKEGYDLANIHIKEGRKAQKEDEIIIEEAIKEEFQLKLNQKIDLQYKYQSQTYSKTYKIVGIMENYSANWVSRGLSFVTTKLKSHENDILIKGKSYFKVYNNYNFNGFMNRYVHPEYVTDEYNGFINDTSILSYLFEISMISIIIIMFTMISSLNKRESQFVMLRCLGMTFKQLQKLIMYEGVLLSLIAGIFAIVSSIILSWIIMLIYSLSTNLAFSWTIDWISLFIELIIIVILLYIGILLPTLTVYDLPLTRKESEYVYHPHKRKIKKPTYLSLTIQNMMSHKGLNILSIILIVFIMMRSALIFDNIKTYFIDQEIIEQKKVSGNYSCKSEYELDLETLKKDSDIIISNNQICPFFTDEDDDPIQIVMIKEDHELSQIFDYRSIKDDQAILLLNQNDFERLQHKSYIMINRNLSDESNKDINRKLIISKSYLNDKVVRDYMNISLIHFEDFIYDSEETEKFALIVNQQTFKNLTEKRYEDGEVYVNKYVRNYIVFNTKTELAKIQVHNCIIKQMNKNAHNKMYYDDTFINNDVEKYLEIDDTYSETVKELVYNIILFLNYICVFYLLRMLLSYKLKKELSLMNTIGMTKKKIYMMYFLQSIFTYMISMLMIMFYWYIFECNVKTYLFIKYLPGYCLISIIIYILYLFCILKSIKNIFKKC